MAVLVVDGSGDKSGSVANGNVGCVVCRCRAWTFGCTSGGPLAAASLALAREMYSLWARRSFEMLSSSSDVTTWSTARSITTQIAAMTLYLEMVDRCFCLESVTIIYCSPLILYLVLGAGR